MGIGECFLKNREISDYSNLFKKDDYCHENETRIVIKHGKNEPTVGDVYNERDDAFYIPIPLSSVRKIIVGSAVDFKKVKKQYSQYFQYTEFVRSEINIEGNEQDLSKM